MCVCLSLCLCTCLLTVPCLTEAQWIFVSACDQFPISTGDNCILFWACISEIKYVIILLSTPFHGHCLAFAQEIMDTNNFMPADGHLGHSSRELLYGTQPETVERQCLGQRGLLYGAQPRWLIKHCTHFPRLPGCVSLRCSALLLPSTHLYQGSKSQGLVRWLPELWSPCQSVLHMRTDLGWLEPYCSPCLKGATSQPLESIIIFRNWRCFEIQ